KEIVSRQLLHRFDRRSMRCLLGADQHTRDTDTRPNNLLSRGGTTRPPIYLRTPNDGLKVIPCRATHFGFLMSEHFHYLRRRWSILWMSLPNFLIPKI